MDIKMISASPTPVSSRPQSPATPEMPSGEAKSEPRKAKVQVAAAPETGYVKGQAPAKTIAGRLHLHSLTPLDYKQIDKKNHLFERLVPSLMTEMEMSQTATLTHLLSALELTPYLRKINPEMMELASDDPSRLQTTLLLELIARIKQGYRLDALCQEANETGAVNVAFNEGSQVICVGHTQFTPEDLGDETFRELRDRLLHLQCSDADAVSQVLMSMRQRKKTSVAYWQDVLSNIFQVQTSDVRQQIAKALNRPTDGTLQPFAGSDCEALTSLLSSVTLTTYPGLTVMRPLFKWLSQEYLNGEKLSSRHLAWLKSMIQNKLYTQLPGPNDAGMERLRISKELLISNDTAENPGEQALKQFIQEASSSQLSAATELFSSLLCDLTPEVTAENRLGIIYTLLKFRDQPLLNQLLTMQSIGQDAFLAMYLTQLQLTYVQDNDDLERFRAPVNCLLKTLQVRMARCIVLMASKEGMTVPRELINRAQAIIDHHNEGLREVLSPSDQDDTWDMDSCDGSDYGYQPSGNTSLSDEDYLRIPPQLLNSGQMVTLDPEKLILPRDKHFRVPSVRGETTSGKRREKRLERDEEKWLQDFVVADRSVDLTQPLKRSEMAVPVSFLFKEGNSSLSENVSLMTGEISQAIRQAAKDGELDEQQTLSVIRQLFGLVGITDKPGVNLRQSIASIQSGISSPGLSHILERLAGSLEGVPGHHDRRQLLEFMACELFAQLNPSDQAFSRLTKTLYFLQSRSAGLRFADDLDEYSSSETNKTKLELSKLFRFELTQPDGLLGARIRKALRAAFKNSDSDSNYQQIMGHLLESMRPANQASESYPVLIGNLCTEVEKRLAERRELKDLDGKAQILVAGHTPNYKEKISVDIRSLIESASKLCQKLQPEGENPTASDVYVVEQLQKVVSAIGLWLNAIRDDDLISEENATAAGIDQLEQFVNAPVAQVLQNTAQNRTEMIKEIIALNEELSRLQQTHSHWQSTFSIEETHKEWQEISNTLNNLRHYLWRSGVLLTPDQLQARINELETPEGTELSAQDQRLLAKVAGLRAKYSSPLMVQKGLRHPDIQTFQRNPGQLTSRIAEIDSLLTSSERALLNQHDSLSRSLWNLRRSPFYRAFEQEKASALEKVRQQHSDEIRHLQSVQNTCESHPLQAFSYDHEQPLLKTLEAMSLSHRVQYSGIDSGPLSDSQKRQLHTMTHGVPATIEQPVGTSLFDMIGRNQRVKDNNAESMQIDENSAELSSSDRLRGYESRNAAEAQRQRSFIEAEHKKLDERLAAHEATVKKLEACHQEMDKLLGSSRNSSIVIAGTTYSYADALTAYLVNDTGFYCSALSDLSSTQKTAAGKLRTLQYARRRNIQDCQKDLEWLEVARGCDNAGIGPDILEDVNRLMYMESHCQRKINSDDIALLKDQVQQAEATINANSAEISREKNQLRESLRKERELQVQKTADAEQELFTRAFEHGHQLSEGRAAQRVLCQFLRAQCSTETVRHEILKRYESQKAHSPTDRKEFIEPTRQAGKGDDRLLLMKLPFHIINVPGAFPLLDSLQKKGWIHPFQLLATEAEGSSSSALIFAAANGRYRACEVLMKGLEESSHYLNLNFFNQLLTASSAGDKRNLMHHVARLARPETLKSLLQLINGVSKKQEYDRDYPEDCLQNRVALDRELLLKNLLNQEDCEGFRPADLLLFNLGKRIREWPEDNEKALASFCNDFLINDAKQMWKVVAGSLSAEQLNKTVECFMKGVSDPDQLSEAKQQAAKKVLTHLIRVFKACGPAASSQ